MVASRVGALPELVGDDAGLLVAPGDPAALAQGITDVLADPVRAARLGAVGRRRAITTYSWAAVAQATSDIYERIVSEHNASRAIPRETNA